MKCIAIIFSLFAFNLAHAELTDAESTVNQDLVSLIGKCSNVDLSQLSNQYNSMNVNAAATKLVFMQVPNNPFMDSSGPKIEKVVKLSKSGKCSVRNANLFDTDLGERRISLADGWLLQCQKQIVEITSKGLRVSDLFKISTKSKGKFEINTLKYDIVDELGEIVGQLSSINKIEKFDPMIADYFPEAVGIGCKIQ